MYVWIYAYCEKHEWIFHEDGFNAFSKSRGSTAIHISNACTKKALRVHGKSLRLYSFIPNCSLKEVIPHKIDAFLKLLIVEITDLYLNRFDIYVHEAVNLSNTPSHEGNYNVRALLLPGTADLKRHQEMIMYAGGTVFNIFIL